MAEIQLTRGYVAIVDDDDFDWLSQWRWCADPNRNTVYAKRNIPHPLGGEKRCGRARQATIFMHRVIMGLEFKDPTQIDHIDHNGINNRRANLRLASYVENGRNVQSKFGSTSKFLGVHRATRSTKWCAEIKIGGKKVHLGHFADENEAAIAYDRIAREHFGEFANLNFPMTEDVVEKYRAGEGGKVDG